MKKLIFSGIILVALIIAATFLVKEKQHPLANHDDPCAVTEQYIMWDHMPEGALIVGEDFEWVDFEARTILIDGQIWKTDPASGQLYRENEESAMMGPTYYWLCACDYCGHWWYVPGYENHPTDCPYCYASCIHPPQYCQCQWVPIIIW